MNPYKKFIKDIGLVSIVQLIIALKGIILLPILTKTLGAELYGIWTLIMATVSLLMPLALLQLDFAMTRFLAAEKDKGKISKGFSSIFAASSLTAFVLSLLLFIFAEPLAVVVFGGVDTTYFVRISAFLVLLAALDYIIIEYFVAFRQMERYAVFMILQTIGEVVLIGYLVLAGYGLFGVIVSLLVSEAIFFAAGFLLVWREVGISKPGFSVIKPYLAFSLPIIPNVLCAWIINLGDRYVIGYFMEIAAVGIYSAAYGLGFLVYIFWAPFSITLLPAITKLYENNNIQELKTHLKYSLKFFLMFAIPALFGLSILSKRLLVTLTTSEFAEGSLIVPVVALGALLFGLGHIGVSLLVLFKKTKIISILTITSALINLFMNIILVPLIGIMGAAVSTLISFAFYSFMYISLGFRLCFFSVEPKFIVKSIVSSIVMVSSIFVLNYFNITNILISICVATVVYFSGLILLRGFTKEEYTLLKDIAKTDL